METNEQPGNIPASSEAANPGGSSSSNGGNGSGDGSKGMTVTRPVGGISAGFSGSSLPSGLFTSALGLEADVSQEFADLAPTFGDVLLSIGTGVADSQAALDKSLVETAKQLSETKITLVTDVIQQLDDDGLPAAEETELITSEVSLINFVSPTVHEWKHVALSMDLTVGAMDDERGMSFTRTQTSAGASLSWFPWAFGGWFQTDVQYQNSHARAEADWAAGQVRLDAMLAPRRTSKFPVPAEVTIGPQMYFSQGAVRETVADDVVTSREVDVEIKVLKSSGAANPSAPLQVDVDRFALSFVDDAEFNGSTTNNNGEVKVTIKRDIPNPFFAQPAKVKLTVRLGQMFKTLDISL